MVTPWKSNIDFSKMDGFFKDVDISGFKNGVIFGILALKFRGFCRWERFFEDKKIEEKTFSLKKCFFYGGG